MAIPPIESDRRPRLDGWLPAPGLPRPLRYLFALVTWPILLVLMAVGGSLAVLNALLWICLGALAVVAVVYYMGRTGVEGFAGLRDHPFVFVPHNWVTAVALAVTVPFGLWWVRSILAQWRREDARRAAVTALRSRLREEVGLWSSPDEERDFIDDHRDELPAEEDPSWRLTLACWARNFLASAGGLVLLWEILNAFYDGSTNAPAAAFVLIALVAAAGGAFYWMVSRGVPYGRKAPYGAPIIAVLAAAAIGTTMGLQERSNGTLRDYCEYGAVSSAEVQGCLDHVTRADIDRLQTDAARFARGDLTQCLSDAGPFCAARLDNMQNADQQDPNN